MNKKRLFTSIVALALLTGCAPKFVSIEPLDLSKNTYTQTETGEGIAFSIARPQFMIQTKMSPDLQRGLNRRLQYDANAISCHLTSEIERMLIAKGIAVTNVFESRDDMTFTQKKETTALLYPIIKIEIFQESNSDYDGMEATKTDGNIKGTAEVSIVMLEPLSGEKVWIKHIYSDKKTIPLSYQGVILNNSNPFKIQENLNNTANTLDSLLVEIDKQILAAVSKYVTKEEFKDLNDDIKKLKGIKRY